MTSLREFRLLHYNQSDFGGIKYNRRTAEANSQIQDQMHQQALENAQVTGHMVGASALDRQNIMNQPLVQNGQPTAQGILNQQQANIGPQRTFYDTSTGQVQSGLEYAADNPTRAAQLQMNATSARNERMSGVTDTSTRQWTPASGMSKVEFETQTAALEQQNTEKMKQEQLRQEMEQNQATGRAKSNAFSSAASQSASQSNGNAAKTSSTPSSQSTTQTTPNPQQTASNANVEALIAGLPPELAYLAPAIRSQADAATQNLSSQAGLYGSTVQNAQETYNEGESLLNKLSAKYEETSDAKEELLKQVRDDQEKNLSEQQANALDQLAWQQAKQTRDLQRAEQKMVDEKIAALALTGRSRSSQGLQDIDMAKAEYDRAISDMQTEYGFKRTDLITKFTGMHNDVLNTYKVDSLNNLDQFNRDLERLSFQSLSNLQAKKKAEQTALETFVTNQSNIRSQAAKDLYTAAKDVLSEINASRDDKRAQEQLGWQRLENVIKTYGSYAPQAILDSIAKQLPGVDVHAVAKQMTLAEMKQFKVGKGGGTGGGANDSSQIPTQGQVFSSITPQELNAAIKRIFTPANYGGTASERSGKQQEYLNRVASGENPASIAADLQSDYWASQKGAGKTAHEGRITAQGSADALQEYADFYAIGVDDDGPLGFFDSKVEGFKSIFGLSSEEYNNLAGNVGNIRAKIIKENYGAAVTPQELALAQAYIPSMSDKGNIFITKLQNLKAYNAYLDAKVFAANAGLPPPKPPKPVTLSGNAIAGPGKYSSEDINSTLNE